MLSAWGSKRCDGCVWKKTWGSISFHIPMLLSAWVRYLLKPMQLQANPETDLLNPMQLGTKAQPQCTQHIFRALKIHMYSSEYCSQGDPERGAFEDLSPSDEQARLSLASGRSRSLSQTGSHFHPPHSQHKRFPRSSP